MNQKGMLSARKNHDTGTPTVKNLRPVLSSISTTIVVKGNCGNQ